MELEFKGPHSNKISLERRSRKKKIGTNLRGIWRREDLKEITMRHFPEKQMALHNFYKNLLQHSTIFFVKSFQQV